MEVKAPSPARRPVVAAWLTPTYVVGLLLVYLGERVLPSIDTARAVASGVGALAVVAVTALRFVGLARGSAAAPDAAERKSVERTLALLSLGGVAALLVYGATTPFGKDLLGIATADADTRARFSAIATIAYVVLAVTTTLPIVFAELALAPMRAAPLIEGRRVRAATITGVSIAFAATYAGLFVYSAGELKVKADFSFFRTAKASESTKRIASSSAEPITVMAFFPELNDVGLEVRGYLDEVAKDAPNMKVDFYDRLLVPALAKEAKVMQDGVIVVKRGEGDQKLSLGTEMKSAEAKLKTLDADFQKALLKSLRSSRTAYMTVGHGELNEAKPEEEKEGRSAKGLRKIVESQNYSLKDLGLAQGLANEVPADAGLVIVAAPKQAFFPEEAASLERYAKRGGKLLLLLDPETKVDLGNLAAIAELTITSTLLASDKNFLPRRRNASDHTVLVTNRFSSHASVSTLSREGGRAAVLVPGAASLDKAPGSTARIDFILKSLPDVFADLDGNFEADKAEKRTTYNIAAAVARSPEGAPKPDDKKDAKDKADDENEMRALVFSDGDLFSDAVLAQAQTNQLLLLDGLRWLGGEESFAGAVDSAEDVRIQHTTEGDKIGFYATIFGMPLLVLGAGLGLGRRKRARSKAPAPTKATTTSETKSDEGSAS